MPRVGRISIAPVRGLGLEHPESVEVEAPRERGHHLDRAARQAERERPEARFLRPVEQRVRPQQGDTASGKPDDLLGDVLESGAPGGCGGLAHDREGLAGHHRDQSRSPFRQA